MQGTPAGPIHTASAPAPHQWPRCCCCRCCCCRCCRGGVGSSGGDAVWIGPAGVPCTPPPTNTTTTTTYSQSNKATTTITSNTTITTQTNATAWATPAPTTSTCSTVRWAEPAIIPSTYNVLSHTSSYNSHNSPTSTHTHTHIHTCNHHHSPPPLILGHHIHPSTPCHDTHTRTTNTLFTLSPITPTPNINAYIMNDTPTWTNHVNDTLIL